MGFFTDAYDLFCISLVTKLLGRIYYHHEGAPKPGILPPGVSAAGMGVAFRHPLGAVVFRTGGALSAVFAMQGFGILTGGIVALVVAGAFKNAYPAPIYSVNALLTYYWRMKMPETARYTALVAKNATKAAADMSKVLNVEIEAEGDKIEKIVEEKGNNFGLFTISSSPWTSLARNNYTVPGYWFTVAFIDTMGRRWKKQEQIVGAFGFLYAAQSTVPSEVDAGYPTGIGVKNALIVLGCVNLLGMLFTLLVPESKGKSLEEMSKENEGGEENYGTETKGENA
ncbi:hypothetical protein HAX54_002901 [Datura stramonium]|uniref:Uncharacterized protein n=1 Tax=Datura stramonium TaxID=4076 RepID=A0ABS8WTT8_DATST|nr:hypothetical protein [Datura stramonium]